MSWFGCQSRIEDPGASPAVEDQCEVPGLRSLGGGSRKNSTAIAMPESRGSKIWWGGCGGGEGLGGSRLGVGLNRRWEIGEVLGFRGRLEELFGVERGGGRGDHGGY